MSDLDTLVTNLQTIHTEVMTKVIPGNIRSGVTIFGQTGTYDGPAKTISQDEVKLITDKVTVLNTALTALEIITSPDTVETLGYTTSDIDVVNDSITITVTNTGTYSVDEDDVVYDDNGDQIYPVVNNGEEVPGEEIGGID